MNDISIHFTLKGQTIEEIQGKLNDWFANKKHNPHMVLHHCFLPREIVVEKGFDTSVVDFLDGLADNQVRWYNTSPKGLGVSRFLMLQNLLRCNGTAIFIGDIKEGVLEEFDHVETMQIKRVLIP